MSTPFSVRQYRNAPAGVLAAAIDALVTTVSVTIPEASSSGAWTALPATAVIDRGSGLQEVVEVTEAVVSGTTLTLTVTRGFDEAGPSDHIDGAPIVLHAIARDWRDLSAHITETSRDDHLSLMRSDGTRHDDPSLHLLGDQIATGVPSVSQLGDSAATGSVPGLARSDHVHGRAQTPGMLAGFFLPIGAIVPIDVTTYPYPSQLPGWLTWADGTWIDIATHPELFALVGHAYPPFSDVSPLAALPSGIVSVRYPQAYVSTDYFAVPCLCYWTEGATTPTWYLSGSDQPPLGWAIAVAAPSL